MSRAGMDVSTTVGFYLKTVRLSFIFIFLLPLQSTQAAMLFVTNAAADSPDCGPKANPCRSINQAIAHAEAGDHILVGPGHYGDINNDGDFDDAGDERAQLGYGCRCMILINKPLTITSIVGANATTLNANGAILDLVKIVADNVAFGETRHGFTLQGASVDKHDPDNSGAGLAAVGNYINIMGNIARNNNGAGFRMTGNEHVVRDNEASQNAAGFTFTYTDKGHIIEENLASNNGKGSASNSADGHGFSFYGNAYTVKSNMASGNNGMGFVINARRDFYFERNTSFGNTGQGVFKFDGSEIKSLKNNIFGNLDQDGLL